MAKTTAAQQRAVHKYVKNNYDRLEGDIRSAARFGKPPMRAPTC